MSSTERTPFAISAEVHTDDHVHAFAFDAAPWFAQASVRELAELAACGWGGDQAADAIHLWMEAQEHPTGQHVKLGEYIRSLAGTRRATGFEVHIDIPERAVRWLSCYRTDIPADTLDWLARPGAQVVSTCPNLGLPGPFDITVPSPRAPAALDAPEPTGKWIVSGSTRTRGTVFYVTPCNVENEYLRIVGGGGDLTSLDIGEAMLFDTMNAANEAADMLNEEEGGDSGLQWYVEEADDPIVCAVEFKQSERELLTTVLDHAESVLRGFKADYMAGRIRSLRDQLYLA